MGNVRVTPGGLAIIPAKAHSSRFPGKNRATLGGRPLLEITVEKVRASGRFDRILVTSDDDVLLAQAASLGVVAARRPPELARDPVQVGGVCLHVLQQERNEGREWPWFGVFLVTNPLIPESVIASAVDEFHQSGARAVASVVRFVHPPQRTLAIRGGRLEPFLSLDMFGGAEELEPLYRHDGGVLILRTTHFESDGRLLGGDVRPVILDDSASVDIDTPQDLAWAEFILAQQKGANVI
jgi:CMP-N-acetylneuraminic acid synthetase